MFDLRPLLRAVLAWALVTAVLSLAATGTARADNGEVVSRTARSNLSEIALSPDGGRIYLIWSDFLDARERGIGEIYFRYRDAGGWHPALDRPPVNLSGSPEVHSEQPTLAVATNGAVHVIWGEGRPRALLSRVLQPGADPTNPGAWGGVERVAGEEDAQNANLAPDRAGGVWAVYTAYTGSGYDIFARHRGAGGGWEGAANVSRSGGGFVGKVAVDGGGAVNVVWWERGTIRYANNARGWSAPEVVAGRATQQTGLAAEPGGRIHLVFTADGGGGDDDRRIAYRTKDYWGGAWSAPEFLSETGNMLEPRIAWADGRLVAAWNSRAESPRRIYVMQNFGNGWRDRQPFNDGFNAASPWIAQGADRVAWVSFRNANTDQIHVASYAPPPPSSPAPTPAPTPAPAPAPNPANPAAAINDGAHDYFPLTGHNIGGAFRDYWRREGGLARFGYPLTEEFTEVSPDDGKPYITQYFERARFEYHPENAAPYDVLLGRLGARLRPADPPVAQIPGAAYFPQTGHNLDGRFRDYWLANGGLAVFGLPLSEAFTETSPTDGKPYLVQYFERNRFEYHPENSAPYDVLLGLLGRQELVARGWLP